MSPNKNQPITIPFKDDSAMTKHEWITALANKPHNRLTVFLTCLICFNLLITLADRNGDIYKSWGLITANLLPANLFLLSLIGLTGRIRSGTILSAGALIMLFAINAAKINHLEQPLGFSDVFLAKQVFNGWDLLSQYVSVWVIALSVIFAIASGLLIIREKPIPLLLAASFLIVGVLGLVTLSDKRFSAGELYAPTAHGAKPWDSGSPARDQGLLASLIVGARSSKLTLPLFDQQAVDAFSESLPEKADKDIKTNPDIILWLGESFFDPGLIKGVQTCDYLPNYCTLANTSLHTQITVPTYGGNTTRTEFEVLTGIPFKSLNTQDYPYIAVVHDKFKALPWTLADQGYQATAIHPHHKSFWQRNRALPLLGFHEFIGLKDMKKTTLDGTWTSDKSLATNIIDLVEKEKKQPQFIFAISMEGHGPYKKTNVQDPERRDSITPPADISAKGVEQWQAYIYHAQNTTRELLALREFVKRRNKPTLVVFFGDHLPGLHTAFKELSFENELKPHQQKTPVLAFANYSLGSEWLPAASHELGLWVLDIAGALSEDTFSELAQATALKRSDDNALPDQLIIDLQSRQFYP